LIGSRRAWWKWILKLKLQIYKFYTLNL
jgi:hypothetical protein